MRRKLFVDCGGYDGCSVIQFLSERPDFDVISFEPNPEFRKYYRLLPTKLIAKAVTTHDGSVDLILDPIDGNGSSIISAKDVVNNRSFGNDDCPTIQVPSVDLSRFLREVATTTNYLVLKLDVEGAEYEILPKMLDNGTIDLVDELLIEFHWDKCGVPEARHEQLRHDLEKRTRVAEWDAEGIATYRRSRRHKARRGLAVLSLWAKRAVALRAWRRQITNA